MAASTAPQDDLKLPTDAPELSESDETIRNENLNASDPEKTAVKPAPASGPPPPPNGGWKAWVQVAAAFAVFFNTWGILNTFGVFQTYYEGGELFEQSSSNISWIGALQAYFVLVSGLLSGPIYDRGYLRTLITAGSFFLVFGFMMLSLCTEYWQVLLAQGFCIGIGGGLLFVPCLAVLPTYFTTRLGLAVGLAASGSSFGGVIYPIVFYRLIGQIGFAWSVRTLGFIALATQLVPVLFMRMRVKPPKPRDILDWSAFTDVPISLFTIACLIGFVGLYVMLFYVSFFALASGIVTPEMAFYLVPILNAGSMFGRTLPNALSDKIGPLNILAPCVIICGALTYALIGVTSLAGIVIITLLYGFFSGVFIALPPVCFVHLTADKSKVGTRMGMGFTIFSFGVFAGGPGGGSVLGAGATLVHSDWVRLWVFGGTMAAASGVLIILLRVWLTKGKLWVKI
ncbi:monocarboxylate transporter [Echria macrotheca]|uniref:Monocarboxylate transporter n=1 Tax=Echria macrotheca TaxID=438768 RepID=A0AAJ0BGT6_9PEZI|nr:monocarboxylate transporter [Echria macrotheca]